MVKVVVSTDSNGIELSDEAVKYLKDLGSDLIKDEDDTFLYQDNQVRSHPDLIRIVKELGSIVGTKYSDLAIVEIPDDVEYAIVYSEYYGEYVCELHRTWYGNKR